MRKPQQRHVAEDTTVFQDRKLNVCSICGTHKKLGITFDINGRAYFLCQPHHALSAHLNAKLDELHRSMQSSFAQ